MRSQRGKLVSNSMFKVKTKRKQHELQTCMGDTVHISTEKKILEIV